MSTIGKLIEFNSPNFPRSVEDDELTNFETMHGYGLAKFIGDGLQRKGFGEVDYLPEDWGWYCEVENEEFNLWYGVCSFDETEFLVQFHPHKPVIRRWFKKIDVSERVEALQAAVFDILAGDADRTMGPKWRD